MKFLNNGALLLLTTGLLVFGTMAVGCSQPAQEEPPTGGTQEPGPEPVEAKVVVGGIYEEPNVLNPILGPSMTYQVMVINAIYSGLVEIEPDGMVVPDLATEVPSVENGLVAKDGLTYTFPLREAVWSDGTPFTSADVKFSWELTMHPDVVPLTTVGFDKVVSCDTPDDRTVVFHLSQPFPPFITAWAGPTIIPKHVWEGVEPADVNNHDMNVNPTVTLGPFTFAEWVAGDHITVEKDPNYWGPEPEADRVIFQVIPDQNAQLAALLNGDINVYYFAPITQYEQLQNASDVEVILMDIPVWWEHMVINLKNPILQDVRVRQALNYAIDKSVLVNQVWQGLAVIDNSPLPLGSWAHPDELEPYPFEVDQAAALLDKAGWVMGDDGYRYKNGQALKLVVSTTARNPWREQSEKIYQDMYADVGIELTIRNVDAATFFGTLLSSGMPGTEPGGWDLAQFQSSVTWDPGVSLVQGFHSSMTADKGGQNYGYYTNSRADELLDEVNIIVDKRARIPLFHELAQLLHDEAPVVYLYSPYQINATRGMTGYAPTPWAVDTWNIEEWAPIE